MSRLFNSFFSCFCCFLVGIFTLITMPETLSGAGAKKIAVVVSILPQIEFVEAIGKDRVTVISMVPPGSSPDFYEPTTLTLKKLSQAQLYVQLGKLPFEKRHMKTFYKLNSKMMIIDTSVGLKLKTMHDTTQYFDAEKSEELSVFDSIDDEHGHSLSGVDPHTWLAPMMVKQQVELIYKALVTLDPGSEAYYYENKEAYVAQLDALDRSIKKRLEHRNRSSFLVFHPTYGYFADAYGLKQISVEHHGKTPTAKQLKSIITYSRKNGVTVIFSQVQYPQRFSDAIAKAIGGTVMVVDPLDPHYVSNMKLLITLLEKPLSR